MDVDTAEWFEIPAQETGQTIKSDREAQPELKKLQTAFDALDSDQQMKLIWDYRAGLWRRLLVAFTAKLKRRWL